MAKHVRKLWSGFRGRRLALMLVAAIIVAAGLANPRPSAAAVDPGCYYDKECAEDCWLACYPEEMYCLPACEVAYCQVCP
jgi:hypothetical protein